MAQETIYESAAETAKKVRKELKESFPNTKFSVKSSTYSMGSSVTAHYMSGEIPDYKECSELVGSFASKSFDGMTDSANFTGYEYDGKRYNGADYVRYQA
jgi:hypothetical protein